MGIILTLCDGAVTEAPFSLQTGGKQREARVAVITNEGQEIYLTLGEGDHTSQRWKLSKSLLKKITREGLDLVLR